MINQVTGVVEAEIDGERVILVPNTLTYFGLNGVGAQVWDLVGSEGKTKESLLVDLMAEFDVDETTCRQDVDEFLVAASQAGALEVES